MTEIFKSYKLPRAVLTFHLFQVIIVWLLGVVPTWFLSQDWKLTLSLALILFILGAIVFFIAYLEYYYFSLELRGDSLTVKSGIIVKNIKTVAFKSIQSLDVSYDPLLQTFGLVVVRLWTSSPQQFNLNSGTSRNRPDFYFYLNKEEAELLRLEVTKN